MKTVFISNNWADAHQQTRLKALSDHGVPLVCLAFRRDYYPAATKLQPAWMGEMAHASYLNRWKTYLLFLNELHRNTSPGDNAYVFGFDLIVLVYLYKALSGKRLKLVYEIPDIRELFFAQGIRGSILRSLESWVIPRLDLLVVTSREFVTEYFVKLRRLRVPEFLVLENKIHPDQLTGASIGNTSRETDKITIGYFGLLRCAASLECLLRLGEEYDFSIILAGIFMPKTKEYEAKIQTARNIVYLGTYDSPTELPALYDRVDVVWAAYPFNPEKWGNHRWARTNRFYESLYFRKLMILQKDTADARAAVNLGPVALIADLESPDEAARQLADQLNPEFLSASRRALAEVPRETYLISNEYQRLIACLQPKT